MRTIEQIKASLPAELQPWADLYGEAIIAMGAEGVRDFIALLVSGDTRAAYAAVLGTLRGEQIAEEWVKITAEWQGANARNAARLDLQRDATVALLRILLTIALAAVGL